MVTSRMFTPGFKLFFGLFAFLFTAAFVFGVATQLQVDGLTVKEVLDEKGIVSVVSGPASVGWKGGVGNHLGYSILLTAAVACLFVSLVLTAYRDADPEAEAQAVRADSVPLTRAPAGTSYAPIVGAFAVALLALGWVRSKPALYAGIGLLVITAGAWTIRAWAERATGDDEVNHAIYKRIVDPIRVPLFGVIAIAFVVGGFSRIMLAVPDKNWSSVVFGVVGLVFFAGVVAVGLRPRVHRGILAALLVVGALGILGGLVWGTVSGPREIEPHGTEAPAGAPGSGGHG